MSDKNNVIRFPGDNSVRAALEDALADADELKGVIVIGIYDKDKDNPSFQSVKHFFGGKDLTDGEALWMLKRFEFELLAAASEMDAEANE